MPLCLTLSDPDGNSILVSGAVPEAARSKETTEEMVRQSLSKLGGTPYYLKKANISLGGGLAVPVSELNRLRREAVEKLSAKRSHPKTIPFSAPPGRAAARAQPRKKPGAVGAAAISRAAGPGTVAAGSSASSFRWTSWHHCR